MCKASLGRSLPLFGLDHFVSRGLFLECSTTLEPTFLSGASPGLLTFAFQICSHD
jgi:hypothetical protein